MKFYADIFGNFPFGSLNKKTLVFKMSGRQNRLTRRSLEVQVLSDVSANVPAETRRSKRKTVHIVEDVQKTVLKRSAEEAKPASPKKRGRKSSAVGSATKTTITNSAINYNNASDNVQKTEPQKRSRKIAAPVADAQQMANQKEANEGKTILPKRGRKKATVVNDQHGTNGEQSIEMIADSKDLISPNQAKKRAPKNARASITQNSENKIIAQASSSIDKEDELQEIIMRKYFHISERLRINTTAKCLRNLINCSKTHTKNVSFRIKLFHDELKINDKNHVLLYFISAFC